MAKDEDEQLYRLKGGIFLGSVAGIAALAGFSRTLALAKRNDPQNFGQGMASAGSHSEPGALLAMRALGWGTLYAVAGTSLISYGIWKLSGANNLKEFKVKMGEILPRIPRNDPPRSRTEFSGLNDLLTYISREKFGDKPVEINKEND